MPALHTLVLLLASCSSCPPPSPPPLPPLPAPAIEAPPLPLVPAKPTPAHLSALAKNYDEARQRLLSYRALPRCLPSGPIACNDPRLERAAANAERQAAESVLEVRRARMALSIAQGRVAAFQTVVSALPADDE